MHRLLLRQLGRHFDGADNLDGFDENLRNFISAIDEAYKQAERDRQFLEHSMDLSSQELLERGEDLAQQLVERKQAEKDRHLALLEAERANRAKSEFLAAMSHDLRTPLNAILGFAEILENQYFGEIGEKYQEYARDIKSSGEHLLALINDILDISTIEAGKYSMVKENLCAREIITDCIKIIGNKAYRSGINLVTKVPKDTPLIYADRRATMQILLNLLSNAVKFTPTGGTVTVSIKALKRNTVLKIADTGRGIQAKDLLGLVDPFTKSKGDPYLSEPGWGLGLAITKSLIDLHGGTLNIESEVAKGTTVTVTLPDKGP